MTVFMYLNEAKNEREKEDLALLIEVMFKQRMLGVKDSSGYYITPAFPKLIYCLQEDNISEDGKYVGTVREGDFLWNMIDEGEETLDLKQVKDILRTEWMLAATDEEGISTLIQRAMSQNFVPMVDDRNCYIGIITRRDIIQNILNKRIDSRYIVLPQEAGNLQTK